MEIFYRAKSHSSLRYTFTLQDQQLGIPGMIYERESPKNGQDRYWYSFGGKYSWEVGEYFAPFTFYSEGKDISHEIFYGVPQILLKALLNYEPLATRKYKFGDFRNCGNCVYQTFNQSAYTSWTNGSVGGRPADPPPHLFSCRNSGEWLDRGPHLQEARVTTNASALITERRNQLRDTLCSSHTRAAFRNESHGIVSKSHTGNASEWISAEHRRIGCINPAVIRNTGTRYWIDQQVFFDLRVQASP